jgi:hypothetical protein
MFVLQRRQVGEATGRGGCSIGRSRVDAVICRTTLEQHRPGITGAVL